MGSQSNVAATAGGDAPVADRSDDGVGRPEKVRPAISAVEGMYRQHQGRLLRFFARRANASEAQDLVQDTFARYAGRTEAVTDELAEPNAYLSRVAVNLLRDRAKFAVRRAAGHHQVFDDECVAGNDPIACLEARDMLRRVDAAVQRLKPRWRQVFLLQRVDGMSYAEIAESTGMSVRAVKKTMTKALFELRRDLGPF